MEKGKMLQSDTVDCPTHKRSSKTASNKCGLTLRKVTTRKLSAKLHRIYYLYFVISYLLLFLCCHLTNKVAY